MRPTVDYVTRQFDKFNRLMFGGRLPRIRVKLTEAKTYLGQCVSQVSTTDRGQREHSDFEMRISTHLDLPQDTVDDVIIHEMIHYFIHYNGLTDSSAHGPIFRSIMQSINTAHGRSLTISHKSTPEEHNNITARRTWRVIAVLHFNDNTVKQSGNQGKVGLKVLPRTSEKVIMYYQRALSTSSIDSVDLYLHDDPYFNRYPTSAALRYHTVEADSILPHLASARRLAISGNKLTYAK